MSYVPDQSQYHFPSLPAILFELFKYFIETYRLLKKIFLKNPPAVLDAIPLLLILAAIEFVFVMILGGITGNIALLTVLIS
ncbi:MAG: hypothetical protein J6B11_02165 [Spirochaetales bacterium]|nr:hypothetical protein [Spirochaetales bacterium]